MTIDTTQLQTDLQTRINSLTGTLSPESILALVAAVDSLTSSRTVSVANSSSLPNLSTTPLPSGSLIFVEQLNIMVMSVGTQWRGIDGRVLL